MVDGMVQFRDIPRRMAPPTPASVTVRTSDGVPSFGVLSSPTTPASSIVVRKSDGVPVSFPTASPHVDAPKTSSSPSNPIASFFSNVGRKINTVGEELDWATSFVPHPGLVRPSTIGKVVQNLLNGDVFQGISGIPAAVGATPVTDLLQGIPGIPSTQFNHIPLTPDNQDLLVTEQTLKNKNDVYGMGFLHDLLQHPWTIPEKLFEALWKAGGYILWTYQDLVDQFRAWDGTLYGLITHMGLLWRAGVTALVTWGLFESAPILEMLFGLLMELGRVLLDLVSWATGATEFVFHWLGVLWDDTVGRLIAK